MLIALKLALVAISVGALGLTVFVAVFIAWGLINEGG
jgi:hypothetical protein